MPLTKAEIKERQRIYCKSYYGKKKKVKDYVSENINMHKEQIEPKKMMTDKSEIETDNDFFMDLN